MDEIKESAVLEHIKDIEQPPAQHFPKTINLANDEEISNKFLAWAKKQFEFFRGQSEREHFCSDDDSVMNMADKMLRVSLNRDSTTKQYQPTLSDVSSTLFFRQHRAITSSLNSIFNDEKDMPAEYEPELNTNVYNAEDGKIISEQRNLLQLHTWDEDKRKKKIKDIIHSLIEYGNVIVSDEWDRRVEMRDIKTVGYYDANGIPQAYDSANPASETFNKNGEPIEVVDEKGNPLHFVYIEKPVVINDVPSLLMHDMKDCFFDARIDDETMWRCFIKLGQVPYETLISLQASGEYENVEKIKPNHFVIDDPENIMQKRKENAGESNSSEPTGLVPVFHVWGVVPIKEKVGKKKSKYIWSPDTAVPQMFWGVYAGSIEGDCVPLKLVKNPYSHKCHPYKMIHAYRDDKGAFHKSLAEIIIPLYWQICLNMNFAIDNIMERNRAPWIQDGPVHTKDLTFRPDKVIRKAKGTILEKVDVKDTTGFTLALNDRLEADTNDTTGANRSLQAQSLGSRTSALEAKNVFDQAMLPLDDMAGYIGDQFLEWLYTMDAALWDQFGDPSRIIMVTKNNELIKIQPSHIWGPVKVKVTSVSRFKNNVIRRQEVNSFIQNVLPQAASTMGQQGLREFYRDAFKLFGFERAMEFFPDYNDYDAKQRAISTAWTLLSGKWIEPQNIENHNAWLSVMVPMAQEYGMLPDKDKNEAGLRLLNHHIALRKNMINNSGSMPTAQNIKQISVGEQGPTVIPGNEAEMIQNNLEAQEGANANV